MSLCYIFIFKYIYWNSYIYIGYSIQLLQLGLLALRDRCCSGTQTPSCAVSNWRVGGGRRNRRHRQVAGASMGAGDGELGNVKARGGGPRGRLLVVSLVSRPRVCADVAGMRVAVCDGCARPHHFARPGQYAANKRILAVSIRLSIRKPKQFRSTIKGLPMSRWSFSFYAGSPDR